jgi:sporulation protein YlmC with PRC-barrel domain
VPERIGADGTQPERSKIMKRFLATTAIVALAAAPVMADTHSENESDMKASESAEMSQGQSDKATESKASAKFGDKTIHAADMIGEPVYIRSEDASDEEIADSVSQPADNWERVGEIGDLILTKDGEIDSVTLDAGGFLGINEKHVSTGMDELKFVSSEGGDSAEAEAGAARHFYVVFTGDRSALEDRDELDKQSERDSGNSFWSDESQKQRSQEKTEGQASNEGTGDASSEQASNNASEQGTQAASDDSDMSGQASQSAELTTDQRDALTADDLQGLSVYDSNDESIGEISELVLSDNGDISKVVIDVGGFLGLGEKPVAVPFEEITLRDGGDDMTDTLRATTDHSSEALEGMQEWKG